MRANNNKSSRTFQYAWPSFFWNLLTNRKLQDIVGNTLWKFIPKEWRYWWMDSITIYDCYEDITFEVPTPYFHDVTIERESMRDSMKSKMLSSTAQACNEHLMPTLLCPWGDTEFLHTCGNIEMDIVIQRLLLCYFCSPDATNTHSSPRLVALLTPVWSLLGVDFDC